LRNADKIIIALLILLFIGAGYFQYVTDELNKRMDVINKVDQKLVDKVEDEFADSLKQYNLRFIGRGKHLRQAQLDIVSNTDLINKNTDSLSSLIDNVDFKLDNFMRETNRNFKNVNNDLEDLSDEVRTNIRRTKQKLADLEQSTDRLTKDLKEVKALPSIIKAIQKMKEEAAKAAEEE
jgi:methyl-accepting chemotaxis protein|tara:strand:+ start:2158 stop:2694 length:537 start_codon:yes stop_codon:yes gene_type:complete